MRFYVKINGSYYEYNTVFDTLGQRMDLGQLADSMAARGWAPMAQEQALLALDTVGTTDSVSGSAQEAVECNCMGPGGSRLTWEELLDALERG